MIKGAGTRSRLFLAELLAIPDWKGRLRADMQQKLAIIAHRVPLANLILHNPLMSLIGAVTPVSGR